MSVAALTDVRVAYPRGPALGPFSLEIAAGEVTIKDLDAGRAAAAAIADNDAWKAERPGQMKIAREGLVVAIKGIIE